MLAEVCDDLQRVWPLAEGRLGLTLVVDDLGVHMRTPSCEVVGERCAAADMVMCEGPSERTGAPSHDFR